MRKLIEYLEKNHISYNGKMIDRFDAYRAGILQWNQFVNLTAIRDPEEFTLKHFVDSVTCCGLPEYKEAEKIMDMGTGAGFPGVPLQSFRRTKNSFWLIPLIKDLRLLRNFAKISELPTSGRSTAEPKTWAETQNIEKNTIYACPGPWPTSVFLPNTACLL